MARSTQGNQHFQHTSYLSVASTVPMSMSIWFNPTTLSGVQFILAVSNSDGSNYVGLVANGTNAAMFWRDSGITTVNMSGVTLVNGSWYCMIGTVTSLSRRDAWIIEPDGTITTGNGTSTRTANTVTETDIGSVFTANEFVGDVAEAAFWDVALSAGEAYSLLRGYSPALVRPDLISDYYRLDEKTSSDNARSLFNSTTLPSPGNPPVAPHPPGIIYPDRTVVRVPAAATADEKVMEMLFRGRQVLAPRSRL